MDALQILMKMNADECMKNTWWGVFTRDELPQSLLNVGYIINTDNKNQLGQHWVALWIEKNSIEFMDSFGLRAEHYGWLFIKQINHSSIRVQSYDSISCGAFCLYYLFYRCRNVSMSSILRSCSCTEYIVTDFVKNL